MAVFRRLANVARGKARVWARDVRPVGPATDEVDRELARAAPPLDGDGDRAPSDDPFADKRALLDRALRDGVLTPEEYDRKLAELTPQRADPAHPKKRTL